MRIPIRTLFALFALIFGSWVRAEEHGAFDRTEGVVYGTADGVPLTLDVFQPATRNGAAIIYIVSAGYNSTTKSIEPATYQPLLDRGYTVFAVVHGSRPQFFVPEIEVHIHRAVRFVRHYATRWAVDPARLGVCGGSSGGQLALTLGTQGGPGQTTASDVVDLESSAVRAVACWFPPTDFSNWGQLGEDAVTYGSVHGFEPPLGPATLTRNEQRAIEWHISPINYVKADMAPTFVIHGENDVIVPLYQSQTFSRRCTETGATFSLIIKRGASHSYPDWRKDIVLFADWFDKHLLGSEARN